jgi:hypothetical protein
MKTNMSTQENVLSEFEIMMSDGIGKWQTLGHNDQVRLTTRLNKLISVIQEITQLDISSTDDRQRDPWCDRHIHMQ